MSASSYPSPVWWPKKPIDDTRKMNSHLLLRVNARRTSSSFICLLSSNPTGICRSLWSIGIKEVHRLQCDWEGRNCHLSWQMNFLCPDSCTVDRAEFFKLKYHNWPGARVSLIMLNVFHLPREYKFIHTWHNSYLALFIQEHLLHYLLQQIQISLTL